MAIELTIGLLGVAYFDWKVFLPFLEKQDKRVGPIVKFLIFIIAFQSVIFSPLSFGDKIVWYSIAFDFVMHLMILLVAVVLKLIKKTSSILATSPENIKPLEL